MMDKKIDLNCDLGESYGAYTIGNDSAVIPLINSANIACGWHAGDPVVMSKTISAASNAKIAIGAHPGYPDLLGFGRRNMQVSPDDIKTYIIYQVGALNAFCKTAGVSMQHVKPHGAMYNMAAKDEKLACAICEGIASVDENLILLGLSGSCMKDAANKTGIKFASEVFADRAYEDDGSLVARSKPGAVITDEKIAVARVVEMAKNGTVTSISGQKIKIDAQSVCVHGDNAHALEFVRKIRNALAAENIITAPISEVL